MTNQVPWNKIILEEFINLALSTKEEELILRTRIYGRYYKYNGKR